MTPSQQLHPPAFEHSSSIDWDLSLQLANHKTDLAQELLGMLVKDLEPTRKMILDCYSNGDHEQLRNHLHRLYGATCYCGVPALKAITETVQRAARKGGSDELPTLIQALNAEIQSVISCYAQHYDK